MSEARCAHVRQPQNQGELFCPLHPKPKPTHPWLLFRFLYEPTSVKN